ncbi:MAG: hypothetical protein L6R42_009608, partial [Xanthoria sp. 1 TBL-2021]
PYDDTTGAGALGVEFAGTAVSSTGNRKRIPGTDADARARINQNEVLQWQDGYYRGYFLMTVGKDRIETQFFEADKNICDRFPKRRNSQRVGSSPGKFHGAGR